MHTLTDTPVTGLVPEISLQPAAAVAAVAEMAASVPTAARSTYQKVRDSLVLVYAYGLLAFGLLAPFALAAWTALSRTAGQ